MIRVFKSSVAPSSLRTTNRYDGEDVKKQLLADQYDKCYLCERNRDTDFEVEHYKSKNHYTELRQDWNNLFMGCRYCNGKKSDSFDNMLNPKYCNIENEIEQSIDFTNNKAVFSSKVIDEQHNETIKLLYRLYNGTGRVRSIKEKYFFGQALSIINRFSDLVKKYKETPSLDNERAVKDELSINKDLLGFKYWIIKKDDVLFATFANDIIWNKTM